MTKDIQKKILFVVIFVILGLLVSQIRLSPIVGAKWQSFTPLEFLGPTSGMFLGSLPGAISVFFVKLLNAILAEVEFDLAFFKKERLILNALGSTFTAHALGSVAFLYAFNLSAPIWIGLIPVVFFERFSFALGIWITYLLLNNVLEKLLTKAKILALEPLINRKYILSKTFFRLNA